MSGSPELQDDVESALAALAAQRDLATGILVAVSGGPDSLALLLAAAPLGRDRAVFVATVDHGLRPEAAEEARLVAACARELGLPHATLAWRHEGIQGNLMGAAREARYRLLSAHARAIGAGAVLTAHHQRDQIETHLLLRARGARGAALAGMRSWRDLEPRVALVRPFLGRDPAHLARVVGQAGWRAVDDASNHDLRFARVRLRQEIGASIPAGADDAMRQAEAQRRAEDEALAAGLHALAEEGGLAISADGEITLHVPMPMRLSGVPTRLLARIVTAAGGGAVSPSAASVERLGKRLFVNKGATLGGCHLRVRLDTLVASRETGRRGPEPALAGADGTAWFDRRFLVEGVAPAERLEALGGRGLGSCRPALRDGEGTLHPVSLAPAGSPAGEPRASAVSTVPWRLWADLPGPVPEPLTQRPQIAAKGGSPVGKV